MKKLLFPILLILSSQTFAIDPNVFKENYTNAKTYQSYLFSTLRNYFESLPLSSIIFIDPNGTTVYNPHNSNGEKLTVVYSKISRAFGDHQITERVNYFLANGISIIYEIKKSGDKVTPSNDLDLLTFNFQPTNQDDFYQISLPFVKVLITHSKLADGESDVFSLGFMEFSLQMEQQFYEREASLSYIYFAKDIQPIPQASISVRAYQNPSEWGEISYIHTSSQSGEITPKLFFTGLNQGAGAFVGGSRAIFQMLMGMGFPKLN